MEERNFELLDNPLYSEEFLLKIRFSDSMSELFNTIWWSEELSRFVYEQRNQPIIKIPQTEEHEMKNMAVVYLIFSSIPYLEKDDWIYISCKDYVAFMIWLAIHTQWANANVSSYTIGKILSWWIKDSYYAVWDNWKKLIETLTNNPEDKELYLRILEDARYNHLKFYDNTKFNSADFHIKLRWGKSDFSGITPEDKSKLVKLFVSYWSILYFDNKVTNNYVRKLNNPSLREWFKEIFIKRDVIENQNLLMATMYSLYSKNDLYLYYCPKNLDTNITETKYINIESADNYNIINFTKLINSISHFDETRELLMGYMWNDIVRADNIEDIRKLFDSLFQEIIRIWVDNIILNVKGIINDKNRYKEVEKIVRRWNVTKHKDDWETWHVEVSFQDSLHDQLKRERKNLKSK